MRFPWAAMIGVVLLFAAVAAVKAEEAATASAPSAPSAEALTQWAAQLDADEYADRKAAGEKLYAAGKAAIPTLSKAAAGESLEATARAMDILKRLYRDGEDSKDDALKAAAKEALEKLAAGKHAASARRAKEILKVEEPQPAQAQVGGIVLGGGQLIINGALQIGGANKKITIKNANGVKEIEAEEDGRKVKILDSGEKGIKMEITTKKDGKETTEKIEAKDAADLKKKNEKAHDLYKQYGDNANLGGGAIQVQIGAVPMIAQAVPVPAAVPPAIQPPPAKPHSNGVAAAASMLKACGDLIDRGATAEAIKQAPQKDREALKAQIEPLKKQLAELEKRLEAEK